MENSGFLIFVIVILVCILFYACVRKIADQLKESMDTWARDHAATENIQLRSPRRSQSEVPEVVHYSSPFVPHPPHGVPTAMQHLSPRPSTFQKIGYEAAQIAKSKTKDNSPSTQGSSLQPQPFQTCWKFDEK